MNERIADKQSAAEGEWSSSRTWKLVFGLKLLLNLALSGLIYFDYSIALFWRLSFIFISIVALLFANYVYLNRGKRRSGLFHLLILDFLLSATYGYIHIAGDFPNHLFVGITALAILMFAQSIRGIIWTCLLLLGVYVLTMGSLDWYVYRQLDKISYFTTGSFIVFAGIVCVLIHFYRSARTDTLKLYGELMQSHAQLQTYALQTEEWGAAKERIRIAREIHDTVGHKLTALLVQMQAARKLSRLDPQRSEQTYAECENLIRASLQEIRLSVRAIRDEPIRSTSLQERLAELAQEFTKWAEVQTTLEVEGRAVALPGDLQLTAYRIVQESLTNAQKHGHARKAEIVLAYTDNGFSLRIRNDGEAPAELKPGFGLINMQERVREWNGEVQLGTETGTGFAVDVRFPYAAGGNGADVIENSHR
ncbi:signal transduction histidine kinase [Paenibacillus rhizosphaerae]|uniref:histidine kinase n=1 Tax=Paenibacillus rhizosphaerae TaxID=297318 RepID=A0A839TQN2_9BACL|nr:sensor histidine kinase [Paenibacillus rhizosphaerae]MBB3129075.1 signal transduction histidine kinase [Paenibacillus rhizosphaerae]